METIRKQIKITALVLSLLVLFQSCRVYNRDFVSLDQAVKEKRRVKIKTIDNKTLKFKKLIYENEEYFGIRPSTFMDEIYKIPIDQNQLQSIRLHNKTLSIIFGISATTIFMVVIGYAIVLSSFDLNLDFGGIQAPM